MRLASVLAVVLCALPAFAGPEEPVPDDGLSAFDVAALKAGEWVEYESVSEYSGAAAQKSKIRWACVLVEGDKVWIETTEEKTVTLCCVTRGDRKITEAWSGEAGGVGKKLAVKPMPAGPAAAPQPETSGTGKVSKDSVTANGTAFDCEAVEIDVTVRMSGMELKSKTTTWTSEKVPFHVSGEEKTPDVLKGRLKWEGKPSGKGGVVKSVTESRYGKFSMTLTGSGADAKQTLKTK